MPWPTEKLERPALRWRGRLELEAATLTLAESRPALKIQTTAHVYLDWDLATPVDRTWVPTYKEDAAARNRVFLGERR